jgi:peptide/nickel transport system ATP-binding protein
MHAISGTPGHAARCVRLSEIDREEAAHTHIAREPVEPGDVVLRVSEMKKHYTIEKTGLLFGKDTRTIKANEQLTFDAREAETVAIVGESGCGKSTFAKVLMGLEEATAGTIMLGNLELGQVPVQKRDAATIAKMQMVFQNPFDTLNPSHSVGSQIARVLKRFRTEPTARRRRERVNELLDIVKLPRDFARRRPRQLSGGQKQRIGIARAFAGNPKLVVADEPVSALDVSVQAAVTELLMDIQRKNRTTMLFISHDLSVVRYLADRIVVMYLGRIMEQGTTDEVFAPPYHPYTEALLSAVPIADVRVEKRKVVLTGELPSALNPPKGCPFSTRCPYAIAGTCDTTPPPIRMFGKAHAIACHLEPAQLAAMKPVIAIREGGAGAATGSRGTSQPAAAPSAPQKSQPSQPAPSSPISTRPDDASSTPVPQQAAAPKPAGQLNGTSVLPPAAASGRKLTDPERARLALERLQSGASGSPEQAKKALDALKDKS